MPDATTGRAAPGASCILRPEVPVLETTVRVASFLFLGGMLLLVASAVPAVTRRFPRAFALGSLLALGSILLVLGGALTLR